MEEFIFVVRIWQEYREIEGEEPRFRGMIQHVSTGEKQYFNDISHIAKFLASYLNLDQIAEENARYFASLWKEKLQEQSSFSSQE